MKRYIYYELKPVKEGHKGGMATKVRRESRRWGNAEVKGEEFMTKWPRVDNTAERYQLKLRESHWIWKFEASCRPQ